MRAAGRPSRGAATAAGGSPPPTRRRTPPAPAAGKSVSAAGGVALCHFCAWHLRPPGRRGLDLANDVLALNKPALTAVVEIDEGTRWARWPTSWRSRASSSTRWCSSSSVP
ncbi:MAG: hypothetical protein ACLRIS_01175 [Flavonifractor plautii]